MKRVPIAEFKAHCSRYVEEAAAEEIVITKHGKPVAKLVAADGERESDAHLIGAMRGRVLFDNEDELLSTGLRWDAES
jgi:prevent-host-death family protein